MKPKVSVIIPCYGVEKYLDRCMRSVLNQTLEDIEIILVDDGSPDKVPEICDSYAIKDRRVKVIHKENAGLGYARNSGLEFATGEYVAFVDSDDYIDTDIYRKLYEKATELDCDTVFCGFNIEERKGSWSKSREVEKETVWRGDSVKDYMLDMVACTPSESLERRYYMSVWHSIYRRSIIELAGVRFLSERDVASEDIPFQIDFLMKSKTIAYLPDYLYYYCANDTSLTATYKPEKYDRFKTLYYILKEKLSDIPGAIDRCHRFFIGYTRTQLHHLMKSGSRSKLKEINRIVDDPIWENLAKVYPATKYNRFDIRMMYFLILKRQAVLLYFNSKAVNLIRGLLLTLNKIKN